MLELCLQVWHALPVRRDASDLKWLMSNARRPKRQKSTRMKEKNYSDQLSGVSGVILKDKIDKIIL